jgi:hypothetical protein
VTFDGNGDIDQPEDDDLRSYLFGPSGDDDAPEKNAMFGDDVGTVLKTRPNLVGGLE